MHVTIVTDDMIPCRSEFSTPRAIRIWGIGDYLQQNDFTVSYLAPDELSLMTAQSSGSNIHFYDETNMNTLLKNLQPDVIIAQNWHVAEAITIKQLPLIIDLDGLDHVSNNVMNDIHYQIRKMNVLRRADYFLCATERQKYFYLGWLVQAGYNLSDSLIAVIPTVNPLKMPVADKKYTFSMWWDLPQEYKSDIANFCRCLEPLNNGSINVNWSGWCFEEEQYSFECSSQLSKRVHDTEIFCWSELLESLATTRVGFIPQSDDVADQITIPAYSVLCLSHGIPVIAQTGSELGRLVEQYGAGWVYDPSDLESLRRCVHKIMYGRREIQIASKNAEHLYATEFRRMRGGADLITFCDNPHIRSERKEGIASHFLDHSHTILNINNPLLNDIYIEDILIFMSGRWDHLGQCLDAVDILFPFSDITLLCPTSILSDEIELTPNCNLIIYESESFTPEQVQLALINAGVMRFDLGIALFDNDFGEGNKQLKDALLASGAKYKVGFTRNESFVILEDSIEKCITDIMDDVLPLPNINTVSE